MYIKLFEGFNKDDYYKNISHDEYVTLITPKRYGYNNRDNYVNKEIFNRMEVDYLNNIGVLCWEMIDGSDINNIDNKSVDNNKYYKCYILKNGHNIYITKLRDDYFLVRISHRHGYRNSYYRCDQFDGLVELLKDRGLIEL